MVDPAENKQHGIKESKIYSVKKKEADAHDLFVQWNPRQVRVITNYDKQIAGFESGRNVWSGYNIVFQATGTSYFTATTDIIVFDHITEAENGVMYHFKEVYVTNLVKVTLNKVKKYRSFIILYLTEESFPFLQQLDTALWNYKVMKQLPVSVRLGNVYTDNDPAFDHLSYNFAPPLVYAQIADETAIKLIKEEPVTEDGTMAEYDTETEFETELQDPANERIYFKYGKHVLCKAQRAAHNNAGWLPEDYRHLVATLYPQFGVKPKTIKLSEYMKWRQVQVSCSSLWQKPNMHDFHPEYTDQYNAMTI